MPAQIAIPEFRHITPQTNSRAPSQVLHLNAILMLVAVIDSEFHSALRGNINTNSKTATFDHVRIGPTIYEHISYRDCTVLILYQYVLPSRKFRIVNSLIIRQDLALSRVL